MTPSAVLDKVKYIHSLHSDTEEVVGQVQCDDAVRGLAEAIEARQARPQEERRDENERNVLIAIASERTFGMPAHRQKLMRK